MSDEYTTGPGTGDIYGILDAEIRADEYELAVEYRARLIAAGDDGDMSEIVGKAYERDDIAARLHGEIRRLLASAGNREAELEAAIGLREVLCECADLVARERMAREAK